MDFQNDLDLNGLIDTDTYESFNFSYIGQPCDIQN